MAAPIRPETIETLRRWEARERKNSRRASGRKSRDLGKHEPRFASWRPAISWRASIMTILLAPFALYEVARAASEFPEADIFYSDEDRLERGRETARAVFQAGMEPGASLLVDVYRSSDCLPAFARRSRSAVSARNSICRRTTILLCGRRNARGRSITSLTSFITGANIRRPVRPEASRTRARRISPRSRMRCSAGTLPAEILEYPTANRARLKVAPWPRVSVIVPTDSPTRAQVCLRDLPRNDEISGPGNRDRDEQPAGSNRSKFSNAENATVRLRALRQAV